MCSLEIKIDSSVNISKYFDNGYIYGGHIREGAFGSSLRLELPETFKDGTGRHKMNLAKFF